MIPSGFSDIRILKPLDIEGFDHIASESRENKVHIIGFSLGAMTALKIAANRSQNISGMSLIAPAAPLELGDFLKNMAGKVIFNTASKSSLLFRILTSLQWLGVKFAPMQMVKTMFAGSPSADLTLLSDTTFKKSLFNGLNTSLGDESHLYRTAVLEYVQPWAQALKAIKCPVTIHHGSKDNWAPIDMAYSLEREINSEVEIMRYENLGHYSTLHTAFPIVLKRLR